MLMAKKLQAHLPDQQQDQLYCHPFAQATSSMVAHSVFFCFLQARSLAQQAKGDQPSEQAWLASLVQRQHMILLQVRCALHLHQHLTLPCTSSHSEACCHWCLEKLSLVLLLLLLLVVLLPRTGSQIKGDTVLTVS